MQCDQQSERSLRGEEERKKFVTLTRDGFFEGQIAEDSRSFNKSTQKRFEKIYKEQDDETFLKQNTMPKVCKGMPYQPPVIATHSCGPRHENTFAIPNNAHSKSTNNGYKRGELGGFFCH